jgi:hypothetical protein
MVGSWSFRRKRRSAQEALDAMDGVRAAMAGVRKPVEIETVTESLRAISYHACTSEADRLVIREVVTGLDAVWHNILQFCQLAPAQILFRARFAQSRENLSRLKTHSYELVALTSRLYDNMLPMTNRMSPVLEDFCMSVFWGRGGLMPHVKLADPRLATLVATEFLKILAVEGYVEVEERYASLTPKGSNYLQEIASTYFYRWNVLKRWLLTNSTSGGRALLGWIGSAFVGVLVGRLMA